jgi:putative transposase
VADFGPEIIRRPCWCLMTNHLHMVASASEEDNLSDILRDFKKFTSKQIVDTIKKIPESRQAWLLNLFWHAGKNNKKIKYYKFWQDGNDAKEINSADFLDQKMEYIHLNPVRAEIVTQSIDYIYSSARDYTGTKGLVAIEFV